MADRSVLTTSTFNDFRREVNGTARDIGDIADLLSASSFIASSTDVVEAIVAINAELPEIKTDAFIFPGRVMTFEGATDDAFETAITFTEPTADRTHTLPDGDGLILLEDSTETSTNKTFTTPTITSAVLNTGASGSAVLDEDDMSSNSATKAVFNTALVIVGVVKVLFVDVSALSVNNIEPSASGKVCVLSAVGSANVKVVSKASSVAPSKDITRPGNINESCFISGN